MRVRRIGIAALAALVGSLGLWFSPVSVPAGAQAAPVVPSQWIAKLHTEAFGRAPTTAEWSAWQSYYETSGCTTATLRTKAQEAGIWLPHMPEEWGGMGLGHVELAMVQAEAAKAYYGPFVFNCMAPDEGNMHTLLHWATDEQKEKYLRPLCEGLAMSCFAMTEPEVAGSDPTLIRTTAVQDGDEWVINGHKWFISNARRASFAILVCRTEDNPDLPQAANSAFLVDIPSDGWNRSTGGCRFRVSPRPRR